MGEVEIAKLTVMIEKLEKSVDCQQVRDHELMSQIIIIKDDIAETKTRVSVIESDIKYLKDLKSSIASKSLPIDWTDFAKFLVKGVLILIGVLAGVQITSNLF